MAPKKPNPASVASAPSPFHDRFLFRGHAFGIGGHLRRDNKSSRQVLWPTVGSVALPVTGGLAEEEVEGWQLEDNGELLVTVERVRVRVEGDFDPSAAAVKFTESNHWDNDLPTVTRVETRIQGLTVHFNSHPAGPSAPPIQVDSIEARWVSRHDRKPNHEPEIQLSTSIQNFRVYGQQVPVQQENALLSQTTYDALKKKYKSDAAFRNQVAKHLGDKNPGPNSFPSKRGGPDRSELTLCRIFKDIPTNNPPPHTTVHGGFALEIDKFGWVYLGEMAISPADRRLTVMRMEVGSPRGGDLDVGGGGTNGSEWPP